MRDCQFARLAMFLAAVGVSVSCGSATTPTIPGAVPANFATVTLKY